jgi:hypothetical protein
MPPTVLPPTTEEIRSAIEAWKDADQQAAKAEKAVADAPLLHYQGLSPSVPANLVGDAKLLRSFANDKLAKALRMMRVG